MKVRLLWDVVTCMDTLQLINIDWFMRQAILKNVQLSCIFNEKTFKMEMIWQISTCIY